MEIQKLIGEQDVVMEFGRDENHLFFTVGNKQLVSRILAGQFPNYELVIPRENDKYVVASAKAIGDAIRRASILTSPEAQSVKFDVFKDKVTISSRSPNLGEAREEVESKTDGKDVVIGFNPTYLADVLKVVEEEEVAISL